MHSLSISQKSNHSRTIISLHIKTKIIADWLVSLRKILRFNSFVQKLVDGTCNKTKSKKKQKRPDQSEARKKQNKTKPLQLKLFICMAAY